MKDQDTKEEIDAEEVKEMDLDEQARPTRKAGRTSVPLPKGPAHKKIKGTRKAR